MRVVIVGDFDAANANHLATEAAIRHAAVAGCLSIDVSWSPTTELATDAANVLREANGVFVTTGSPYRSFDGALGAIRHARETGLPLLGTCGGFQHVVLEAFRHVAGVVDAAHGEYDPSAPNQVIAALACSLVGRTMKVEVASGTRAAAAYGSSIATERYYCQYGIADSYRLRFAETGLTISGHDTDGEPRVVELAGHAFFMATLFVPQASSTPERPHPLITAFLRAVAA